ncbi:hypothetical protein SUGI_0793390 [Cryptomeria japonica]|nr:hypothetical protein SUGI_0793390 [Cryptomeria japonica]
MTMEVSFEQPDLTVIKENKIHRNKYLPSVQPVDEVFTRDASVDIRGSPSIKSKSGNWRACLFILANECCERLAYYGITTNLVHYLKNGFGQSNATAANNDTNWSGTCYITPLLGGFLADSYWGRFWTIAVFSTVYFIGMTVLTLSAFIPKLKPPFCSKGNDECHSSKVQIGVSFLALYLIALGTGGIKPCVSSFGADQFDEMDEEEKKKKSSFFNWFYLSINIGALVASSVLVWIQVNVGWGWGFGIPTVTMGIAICSFLLGTKLYRHKKPAGSALTRIAQVVVASTRKWRIQIPSDKFLLYEVHDKELAIEGSQKLDHTDNFLFLDKAATRTEDEKRIRGTISPWQLTTVTQVEELKSIIRLLPIWACGVIFATVFTQMSTLFILQGDTMNLHVTEEASLTYSALESAYSYLLLEWQLLPLLK